MQEIMVLATIIAPIIVGLVELIKRSVALKRNFVPLIALLVGLVVGITATPFTTLDIVYRLWAGVFAGLSATGLFELVNQRTGYTKGADEDE
ncbi:holin [Domibacillus antri]|uniref:Holin n=2 Tax=Domibacillus antri TaxID=1714264 RepID=A0A1Q8Q308_9BACI|nr:holin [Domibacillus antri]OLN21727.1 holin [Domibacillus antri]